MNDIQEPWGDCRPHLNGVQEAVNGEDQERPKPGRRYFADKDALLIAALDALVAEAVQESQRKKPSSLDGQLLWLLDVLEGAKGLVATVHARVPVSPALRAWHDNFHRLLETLLQAVLSMRGLAAADLPHASRVTMFVVEGLLAHPRRPKSGARWYVGWSRGQNHKIAT